ncbi:hypothetical protein E4U21_007661 [Claviceps maximensis]|nr:hypothetical protein E4U21_007661 [Claviceps maximensis]
MQVNASPDRRWDCRFRNSEIKTAAANRRVKAERRLRFPSFDLYEYPILRSGVLRSVLPARLALTPYDPVDVNYDPDAAEHAMMSTKMGHIQDQGIRR